MNVILYFLTFLQKWNFVFLDPRYHKRKFKLVSGDYFTDKFE